MISMLQAMPEAVHFDYSQKDGDYLLRGVGDKNSFFMPSWQQKTQGDTTIPRIIIIYCIRKPGDKFSGLKLIVII